MTEKQKIRSEISKQYKDEIAELKRQIHLRDGMILRMQRDIDDLKKQKTKLPLHLEAVRRIGGREDIAIQDIVDYCVYSNLIADWLCPEHECSNTQ